MIYNREDEEKDTTPYPRWRRIPSGDYGQWSRAPKHKDEVGALAVIEAPCADRVALFEIPGDRSWVRVVTLGGVNGKS